MTKLDRLNSFLSERLTAALNEIIYTVSMTMKEYEEETARIREENYHLKEMLKVSRVTEANPVVTSAVVPSIPHEQEDSRTVLEQDPEPQGSQNGHWGLKEESSSIKTEQSSFPTDAGFEPESRQTYAAQPDFAVDPLQCPSLLNSQAVDPEMLDYEFPAKIKTETVHRHSEDTTDNADASTQSWSPQNWDVLSDKSERARLQQVSVQPGVIDGTYSAEPVPQSRPVEFRAAFSYTNRIICHNTLHCTSKHCEMQKRTIAKSSPVWKYFSLKEGDCSKAVCLMCKAVISRGVKEYTTSALLKHLRMKHGKC